MILEKYICSEYKDDYGFSNAIDVHASIIIS